MPDFPDELREFIRQGIISKTHGIITAKLDDPSGEKEPSGPACRYPGVRLPPRGRKKGAAGQK